MDGAGKYDWQADGEEDRESEQIHLVSLGNWEISFGSHTVVSLINFTFFVYVFASYGDKRIPQLPGRLRYGETVGSSVSVCGVFFHRYWRAD